MKKVKIDYNNIPDELKKLDQFICFDVEPSSVEGGKDRKIPYTPGSAKKARSNEASTWRSFDEAMEDVTNGARQYLGFCFSVDDPYIFFDLDEPQTDEQLVELKEVMQVFPSWTEKSISGKGAHIIAKGKLDGRGLHNEYFGLFDSCRFILLTGHIVKGKDKIRIANKDKLAQLQTDVRTSSGRGYNFPLEEVEWDMPYWALYNTTLSVYKQKFIDLMGGEWKRFSDYPSQSEADHALLSMLCEFSESNSLVRYLFAESGLYREWKGGGDPQTYIDYTIQLYREKTQAEIERRAELKQIAQDNLKVEETRAKRAKKSAKKKAKRVVVAPDPVIENDFSDDELEDLMEEAPFAYPTDKIDSLPSEIHRMLATWLYRNSFIPNEEVSIVMTNIIITSITQRAYLTPTNTGLNLNWWLVADSGKGKDVMAWGFDAVITALSTDLPHFGAVHVGKMASGEAIESILAQQPRFVSKVSEAGPWWRRLLAPNKPPFIDSLSEGILNLFMSTDKGKFYRSRRKAKSDDDIKDSVFRAAGSFYGETTFADFFGDLDISAISTGLLQRQIIVGLGDGDFVEENHYKEPMPHRLKQMLTELIGITDNLDLTNDTVTVRITKAANYTIKNYSRELRKYTHKKNKDPLRAAYMTRTAIKAYRFASQLAIGNDPHNPVIKQDQVDFAIWYVNRCDDYMVKKFTSGEVGKGQLKQEADIMHIVHLIVGASAAKRARTYRFPEAVADDRSLVTYSRLRNEAKKRTSFQADSLGAITAIDRCIDSLCKAGILSRMTRNEALDDYGSSANLLRYNA